MTLPLLLTLLIVASLSAVMAYQAKLNQETTLSWMRLHSQNLGLGSQAIDRLPLAEPARPAEPRRIHKLSIPIPLGGVSREKAASIAATAATSSR